MPEGIRISQAVSFAVAGALGVAVMILIPRACSKGDTASSANAEGGAYAPAPDTIASRSGNGYGNAKSTNVASQPALKRISAKSAQFEIKCAELAKRPLDEVSEQLDELMEQWASEDPVEAAAWVKELTPGEFRETAAISLCQTWAGINPQAAAAWVAQNLDSGMLQGALGGVASVWAHSDPESAAKWIASLPEGDRTTAEMALAQAWAEVNPAAAGAWMKSLSPASQSKVVENMVAGMAASDPAAAAVWLQSAIAENPTIPVQNAGVIVASWVASDAGAVSRWLNALPEGPLYEAAATAFAQAAAEKSPADALLWARALASPENREQAVIYAMELWIDQDRNGFVEALPKQLEATTDPALRKAIYEMLYRKDPGFRDSLLNLAETPDTPAK